MFSGLRGRLPPLQLLQLKKPPSLTRPSRQARTATPGGMSTRAAGRPARPTARVRALPFQTRRTAAGVTDVAGPTARCPGARACRAGGSPRAVASRSATPGAGRVTESSGRGAAGNGDGACAAQGGAASSTAASTWASTPRAGPTAAVPHPSPPSPPAGFCGPSGPGGSDPDSQRLGGTRLGPRRTRMRGA